MTSISRPNGIDLAVRCHDISTAFTGKKSHFENLILVGMSVRLALHLQGTMQPISYELLKLIALHVLKIGPLELNQCVSLLAEVEFIDLVKAGNTLKSITPRIPYYEDLFRNAGEFAETQHYTEEEQLTLALVHKLAESPLNKNTILNCGAEPRLIAQTLGTGRAGGYISEKRAKGKDIYLSPIYFAEHADAYANLAASTSSTKLGKVLKALALHQGWPLTLIRETGRIGEESLDQHELAIVNALAGDGFALPPAIEVPNGGAIHFLFSPHATSQAVAPHRKHLHECAMALVSAVRKGQLLPSRYAIRNPKRLLEALKERRYLEANSEAAVQYRTVVMLKIGRLEPAGFGRFRFRLADTQEADEVVSIALSLLSHETRYVDTDPEFMTALREGEEYVESLAARMTIQAETTVLTEEHKDELETLLLQGG